MRAVIYNPYLDTMGGGERYSVSFALAMKGLGYEVYVQWPDSAIMKALEVRFGVKLEGIKFIKDINRGDGYDICFWLSDGSIPLLRARKNILHFQFPFKDVGGDSLLNKMKLFRIDKVVCNSFFTKRFIDEEYGVESIVIYPPVDVGKIKPKRKENNILYVGRFSQLTQKKGQDVLISVFKKLYNSGLKEWRLILAGGVEVGNDGYVERLRKEAEGYPIEILESPSFDKIKELYGKARIFWSAVGYGEDELRDPTKVEHFGISVVEAMAAGAVPIVHAAGGHREIIEDAYNGFLWKKKEELIKKTELIIGNGRLLRQTSLQARQDAKVYEYERFEAEVGEFVDKG